MSEQEQIEINYLGHVYTFYKKEYHTAEDFYHISWLIAKQLPKTEEEVKKATQLATMWYNQKKYNCRYAESLQPSLSKLDSLSVDF
jgi:hypothetical protein|uniref:Uncharacterized protein n=1 Tax=viral metagenome TaxID=1070528 RepID=A0A6C0E7X2_9ZZZZ